MTRRLIISTDFSVCSYRQGCIFIQRSDTTKIREFTLIRYHRRFLRPRSGPFLCPNHVLCSRRIPFRISCCIWLSRLLCLLQSGSIPVFSITFLTLPLLGTPPQTWWASLPLGLPGASSRRETEPGRCVPGGGKVPAVRPSSPGGGHLCQVPAGLSLSWSGWRGALDAGAASQAAPERGCSFLLGKK